KAWAKRVRIWRSSFFGKTPTMRSIVLAASIVWSVERTRWPVSEASRAMEIVSTSRISPTRMTLGAWRRAARRARAKVWVSEPTSRWLMVARLWGCRYSIGSSIVMTWIGFSRLILLMMAASVVLLPDPGRTADGEVEVRDAGRRIEHRLEQRVEVEESHRGLRSARF